MAIYQAVGGVDSGLITSGKITLDRATGNINVVDSDPWLQGRSGNLCFVICQTDDNGENPVEYDVKVAVTPSPLVANDIEFCIDENPTPLTTIGALSASGGVAPYTFSGSASGAPLAIDADGTVTVAIDPITLGVVNPSQWDYETTPTWTFTYTVTDSASSTTTGTTTITLKDVDEPPQLNPSEVDVKVNETEPSGYSLGDASTLFGSTDWVLASIVGGDLNGEFTIDPSQPGEITTTSTLDADTTQDYTLSIKLTKSSGENSIGILSVAVNSPPVADATASFSISENLSIGDAVGTLTFSDPQGGVVLLSTSSDDAIDPGKFAIGQDGQITVNGALDYDAQSSYELTVNFEDDCGLSVETVVTIELLEVLISDQKLFFDENSGANFAIFTYPDSTSNGAVTYSITSGNNGEFAFNGNVLETAFDADFEGQEVYTVGVSATDGVQTSNATLTICVNDINEAPTLTLDDDYKVYTSDIAGTSYGFAVASDDDANGITGGTYSIVSDTSGLLSIDASTGEITRSSNTAPAIGSYSVEVRFEDAGGLSANVTAPVDLCETLQITTKNFSLNEDFLNTGLVGQLFGTGGTGPYNFSLVAGGDGPTSAFTINSSDYLVLLDNSQIDFETLTPNPFTLMVQIIDFDNNTELCPITVTVNDVNEAPGALSGGPFKAFDTDPANTSYGTITATDPDASGTAGGTYSIIAGNGLGLFSIDGTTGDVTRTATGAITGTTYTLTIEFEDAGGLSFSDDFDIDGCIAMSVQNKTLNIDENPSTNDVIGNVSAVGGTAPYSYSIIAGGTTPSGAVTIDSSGDILVSDASLFDFETLTPNPFSVNIQVVDNDSTTIDCLVDITVNDLPDTAIIVTQDFCVPSDYIEVSGTSNITPAFTVTSAMLDATESGVADSNMTITVDSITNGQFIVGGSVVTSFTQQDINSGLVRFEYVTSDTWSAFYNNQSTLSPSATITASSPTPSSQSTTLNITPKPAMTTFDVLFTASAFHTITTAEMNAIGINNTNSDLTYNVTTTGSSRFYNSGTITTTFTQQDVIDGDVLFERGAGTTTVTAQVTCSNGENSPIYTDTVP